VVVENTTVAAINITTVTIVTPVLIQQVVDQTVVETTVLSSTTTSTSTTTPVVLDVETTTVMSKCTRTKLLFSNLIESAANRSLNRFNKDVNAFAAHLDNLNYTDTRHQSWMLMVRKLVCVLNKTVNENERLVAASSIHKLPYLTRPIGLTSFFPLLDASRFPTVTVSSITSVTATAAPVVSTAVPTDVPLVDDVDTDADQVADTNQYKTVLKLIKYEYFRNADADKDDDKEDDRDDDDEHDSNGQMSYYYKSLTDSNRNSQLYF
jgi:hypothetical protein